MTAAPDFDESLVIQCRTDIPVPLTDKRKGAENIEACNGLGSRLDILDPLRDLLLHLDKELVLEVVQLVLGTENRVLEIL